MLYVLNYVGITTSGESNNITSQEENLSKRSQISVLIRNKVIREELRSIYLSHNILV